MAVMGRHNATVRSVALSSSAVSCRMRGMTTPVHSNTPPNRAYLVFIAEITVRTTEELINGLTELAQKGCQEVYLAFSSSGGDVQAGLALFNFLKGAPFNVIVHNIGAVQSIATTIFLAGKQRYACKHSTFVYHGVASNPLAGSYENGRLRATLEGIGIDQEHLVSILKENTKIGDENAEALYRAVHTKTAEFALDNGIIHEIRELSIPQGAVMFSLIPQR